MKLLVPLLFNLQKLVPKITWSEKTDRIELSPNHFTAIIKGHLLLWPLIL